MCRPTRIHPATRSPVILAAFLALATAPSSAQTFQGLVSDVVDGGPVAHALVRLVDEEGRDVGFALADSAGRYTVEAPEPGAYRLVAERLGYASSETPLLRVDDPQRTYGVDLQARKVPLPIPGIEVSVARQRELEKAITVVVGSDPRALRTPPIPRRVIEDHVARNHSLSDLIRWSDAPITVTEKGGERCFEYRRRCMRVFLNGVLLNPDFWDVLPLDMVETVVIVGPNESVLYDYSILLYSAGWLR